LHFGYVFGGDVIKKIFPVNANGALGFTESTTAFNARVIHSLLWAFFLALRGDSSL